jgi:hypothetical protein
VRRGGWGQTQIQKIPKNKMAVLTRGTIVALVARCQLAVVRLAEICEEIGEAEGPYPYWYVAGMVPEHELDQVVWFLTFMALNCGVDESPTGPYVEEERVVLWRLIDVSFLLAFPEQLPPLVLTLMEMVRRGETTFCFTIFPEGEWTTLDQMVLFGFYVVEGGFFRCGEGDTIMVQVEPSPPSSVVEHDDTVEVRPSSLDDDCPEFDSDGNVVESSMGNMSKSSTDNEEEADRVVGADMVVS